MHGWVRKMTQFLKCLVYKHKDQNLDNQILYTCHVDTLVILDTEYRDGCNLGLDGC